MKILTLNCYGLPFTNKKKRFKQIASMIKKLDVDVVCLQEVLFVSDLKYFQDIGYKLFYEGGRRLIKGGLVIMASERSREVEFMKFATQGKLLSKQVVDRLLGKGMSTLELDEFGITLVNAHLVRVYKDKNRLDKYQLEQVEALIGLIEEKKRVIVVGDLNIHEGSALYKRLAEKVNDLTHGMGMSFLKRPEKLDYVLSSFNDFEVRTRCFVDELLEDEWNLSDHRGIYLELVEAETVNG